MAKKIKPIVVRVGTTWVDDRDRIWEVWDLMPPGRACVRTIDRNRIGEMQISAIKKHLKAARVLQDAKNKAAEILRGVDHATRH